jgi:hypothetical protein
LGIAAVPAITTNVEPSAATYGDPHQASSSISRDLNRPLSGSKSPKKVLPSASYPHTIRPSSRKANERDPKVQAG